jgi:hypothetical protein
MPEKHPSIQEAFEAAFERAEAEESKDESVADESTEGQGEQDKPDPDERAAGESDDSGEQSESEESDKEEPDKEEISAKEEPDKEDSEKEEVAVKAPASWTPKAREHWKTLPAEIKQEVVRREQEITQGLQQASGHKRLAEEYWNTVRPYENLIRAQNSTPAQAITNMMNTASRLMLGTQADKARTVAEIIKNYEVDVETLDSVLVGTELPSGKNADLEALLNKKLAPVQQFMQTIEQQRAGGVEKTYDEVNSFGADPKNEFYEDVRFDMADIIDSYSVRGKQITLQEAYDRACKINPEVSAVLDKRASVSSSSVSAAELAKKKIAAKSVHGSKAGTNSSKSPKTILGSLEEAWDTYSSE